jgi:gamma-glutamyl-gamma-aminobutyrate hydrolase PuuD
VLITSIPRAIETTLPGRTDSATVNQRLGALVVAAGGIPVATDMWADPDQLVARVDALVINGGVDVDAGRYGAIRHPSSDAPQSRRDGFELGLIAAAQERGLPIVGICRGLHLLNVARGGTLHQHLPDVTDLVHYVTDPYDRPAHEIAIEPGSRVAAALGRRAAVNSVHHQGVDRLGSGLAVSARAPDGTIEAIEDPDRPLIGVQWHPEFLVGAPGTEQVAVFRALVRACARAVAGRPATTSEAHHRTAPVEVAP